MLSFVARKRAVFINEKPFDVLLGNKALLNSDYNYTIPIIRPVLSSFEKHYKSNVFQTKIVSIKLA